jgi:hypothetical protein
MAEVIFSQKHKLILHLNLYFYNFHSSMKIEQEGIGGVKIEQLIMQNASPEWICLT